METLSRFSFCYRWGVKALLSSAFVFGSPVQAATDVATQANLQEKYGRFPLSFIENRGQVDRKVQYYARGGHHTVFFTREGLTITLPPDRKKIGSPQHSGRKPVAAKMGRSSSRAPGPVVRLQPVGLRPKTQVLALGPRTGKTSYFIGDDPSKWRTDIPTYGAVLYREAYPGIDLKFYGSKRQLEYDVIVQPGADPARVQFQYRGAKRLRLTPEGDLVAQLTDGRELRQKKPIIYQEIAGQRVPREGKFRLAGNKAQLAYGFEVAAYDRKYPLVIDPEFIFSTFLGGTGGENVFGLAVDSQGNAYVTGFTLSSDFPTKNSPYAYYALEDVFVTKINSAGNALVYSAIVGGERSDYAYGIAVDGQGNACVTGLTYSYSFPKKQALYTYGGSGDAFVFKLNATGNDLVYSTYLGGGAKDEGDAIAADRSGNAYVTTYEPPLSIINSSGTALLFSLPYPAIGIAQLMDARVALDQAGNIFLAGWSVDGSLVLKNPLFTYKGNSEAYLAKLSPLAPARKPFPTGILELLLLGD
jgi:hypothetical protein